MPKEALKRRVEKIVARFLSIGGENEINIPAAVRFISNLPPLFTYCRYRDTIMDGLENPTLDIFDNAVKEVHSMMQYV